MSKQLRSNLHWYRLNPLFFKNKKIAIIKGVSSWIISKPLIALCLRGLWNKSITRFKLMRRCFATKSLVKIGSNMAREMQKKYHTQAVIKRLMNTNLRINVENIWCTDATILVHPFQSNDPCKTPVVYNWMISHLLELICMINLFCL